MNLLIKSGSNVDKMVDRLLQEDDDYFKMISNKSVDIMLRTQRWYLLEPKLYPMCVTKALCDLNITDSAFNYANDKLSYLFSKISNNKKIDWKDRAGNHPLSEYFINVPMSGNDYALMCEMKVFLRIS